MRFHLLAPPNTQTTRAYSLDGFTSATINFARILKSLGHYVILYGSEDCDAPFDEFVSCISKERQEELLGGSPYQYAGFDNRHRLWSEANERIIQAIGSLKKPRDFICTIGGVSQKSIADAHPDLMTVEYSIGYEGCYSKFRVFQSEAWRNTMQGRLSQVHGRFFDAVIPYFFDPTEFKFNRTKKPFLLYVGRLTSAKGIGIICQTAEASGMDLKVIGHGDLSLLTGNRIEFLGAVSREERNEWMGRAAAIIAPTQYIEPFGSVVVEAALTGTPAITTDFGAFTETVEQGVTGFRCNVLGDFVRAVEHVKFLNPGMIRARACVKYSLDAAAIAYRDYFNRLMTLWDAGWNTL
jgi:glycosyltransferase involved in cell wall biosynthesis